RGSRAGGRRRRRALDPLGGASDALPRRHRRAPAAGRRRHRRLRRRRHPGGRRGASPGRGGRRHLHPRCDDAGDRRLGEDERPSAGRLMDFTLSHEQRHIQETIRDFGEREVKPHAAAWDREERFPHETVQRLGALGFLGVALPEDVGGGGADTLANLLVVEGIARYDASLGLTVASHTGLASGHINVFGSETLRRRYLPRMAPGEWLGAWCLTEPGSGSDAAALRTRAVRDGDSWVLSGTKMFITQGTVGHVYVVMASTAPEQGQRGVSAFVVEKGTPGLSNGRKIG